MLNTFMKWLTDPVNLLIFSLIILLIGVIFGKCTVNRPKIQHWGRLVIEPDNAGALVDLDDIPKEVMGNAKDGDVIVLIVKRMPIDEYARRKENVRESR